MARPSKYNEELQKSFDDLVENLYPMGTTKEDEKAAYNNFWDYGIVEQIALYLGINIDTIYDWSNPESDRYKEEFSETFKKWHIITKALLHKIGGMMAEKQASLHIFLRKTKLGELEVNKHVVEDKLTTESEKSLIIRIEKRVAKAEMLGVPKERIDKVKKLLAVVKEKRKAIMEKGADENRRKR